MIGNREDMSYQSIQALMVPQRNSEIFQWLQKNQLISSNMQCKRCGSSMSLTKDKKVLDKIRWCCEGCKINNCISIRQGSFFKGIHLELGQVMKAMMLWCEGNHLNYAGVENEKDTVLLKRVFLQCDKVASKHLKTLLREQCLLGGRGEDSVVLVDQFPGGYLDGGLGLFPTRSQKKEESSVNKFLCIADTTKMPPVVWMQLLHPKNMISQLIKDKVTPGSIIVTNCRTCPAEKLRQSTGCMVINVEELQQLDEAGKLGILDNLETIWQQVIPILQEAEMLNGEQAKLLIARFLWHQRYSSTPSTGFNHLLQHILQQFPPDRMM